MPVRKISIALDEAAADQAVNSAAAEGVSLSAWLNDAVERKLRIQAGLAAVREWEVENGPLTPDELAHADAVLDRVSARVRRPAS